MILHSAIRVKTARADTRVQTFLLNASEGTGAVLIDHALRSAVRRCSIHTADTRAYRMIFLDAAIRIRSAGRRQTRIRGRWQRF